MTAAKRRATLQGLEVPTDLQVLGRAFLAEFADRLGHQGVAGVLMLLVGKIKRPGDHNLAVMLAAVEQGLFTAPHHWYA